MRTDLNPLPSVKPANVDAVLPQSGGAPPPPPPPPTLSAGGGTPPPAPNYAQAVGDYWNAVDQHGYGNFSYDQESGAIVPSSGTVEKPTVVGGPRTNTPAPAPAPAPTQQQQQSGGGGGGGGAATAGAGTQAAPPPARSPNRYLNAAYGNTGQRASAGSAQQSKVGKFDPHFNNHLQAAMAAAAAGDPSMLNRMLLANDLPPPAEGDYGLGEGANTGPSSGRYPSITVWGGGPSSSYNGGFGSASGFDANGMPYMAGVTYDAQGYPYALPVGGGGDGGFYRDPSFAGVVGGGGASGAPHVGGGTPREMAFVAN